MKKITLVPHSPIKADHIVLDNFPKNCKKVLDYGCGNGDFAVSLRKKTKNVYGCDIDRTQISIAKKRKTDIKFRLINQTGKIPYKDNTFDCITLMGVLEHVLSEKELLSELDRIMTKDGVLFIYVLNTGLLEIFDSANLKFRFPFIHKLLYQIFYDQEAYSREFVNKKKEGMIGDFTLGKRWHTHYSIRDLKKLLPRNFKIEKVWYYSLFLPIILVIEFTYASLFKHTSRILSKLIRIDQDINVGKYSYSLVVKCIKK